MAEIPITQEIMETIARLPEAKRRSVLAELSSQEFGRCEADFSYWVNPKRHGDIPYVYTLDPHVLYCCRLCDSADIQDSGRTFNKRGVHLKEFHNLTVEDYEAKSYFRELPTTRPLWPKEYFYPIWQSIENEQLVLIEKSRDMMLTWIVVLWLTWDTVFHEGRENIFQSENASKTRELVRRAWFVYKKQPKFLQKYGYSYLHGPANAGLLDSEDSHSHIIGFPEGADQIRQYHPSAVFTDETAFHKSADLTFAAVKPSIQNGGRYIGISSAWPGWFYLACRDLLDSKVGEINLSGGGYEAK
jgi:hypothetical protein